MTNKKDEWGNIELPGLSDKELFEKNWNRIAGVREAYQDPLKREAQRKKASYPKTQDHCEKLRNVNLGKKRKGESWIADMAKTKLGNGYHNKQIHSVEHGTFPSKKKLAEYMTSIGIVNAGNKLTVWLNPKNPKNRLTEYYYVKQ